MKIDTESKVILFFGSIVTFILLLFIFYSWIVSDKEHDFIAAKTTKKVITCNGLLNTYILEPDDYKVYENNIVTRILLLEPLCLSL